MKLLYCLACHDMVRLLRSETARPCACRKAAGRYVDARTVEIKGPAVVVAIENTPFLRALDPSSDQRKFDAQVVFEPDDLIRRVAADPAKPTQTSPPASSSPTSRPPSSSSSSPPSSPPSSSASPPAK